MQTIKVECSVCNSTGLYIGFAEPKGTAVVCVQCGGDGCEEIVFTPFIRRKGRRGIHTVSRSCGSFLGTGVGAVGISITYHEFKQGKMP
ncbi:MAG: hypothetical protein QQN41_08230 [Nitrosopumilus sp.]